MIWAIWYKPYHGPYSISYFVWFIIYWPYHMGDIIKYPTTMPMIFWMIVILAKLKNQYIGNWKCKSYRWYCSQFWFNINYWWISDEFEWFTRSYSNWSYWLDYTRRGFSGHNPIWIIWYGPYDRAYMLWSIWHELMIPVRWAQVKLAIWPLNLPRSLTLLMD